jgi:hypothetical protein
MSCGNWKVACDHNRSELLLLCVNEHHGRIYQSHLWDKSDDMLKAAISFFFFFFFLFLVWAGSEEM